MFVFSGRPSVYIGILAECVQSESFPPEPCHMDEISGVHICLFVMLTVAFADFCDIFDIQCKLTFRGFAKS